jgi:hypothetical protein
VFSSKSRRRRTSSGAELGGEGQQEASHHHQQASATDNNSFVVQLQAPGRIDPLQHDMVKHGYHIEKPSVWQSVALPSSSQGIMLKAK